MENILNLHKLLYRIIIISALIIIIVSSNQVEINATNVSGHITQDTQWTIDNSPYIIDGDVTVDNGVTLTIEPGVEVKFNAGARLIVNGSLIAVGDPQHKIIFTSSSDNPNPGDWATIEFTGSENEKLILNYSEIRYASTGVTIKSLGEAFIQNTLIELCSDSGITTIGIVNLQINDCSISSVKYGIKSIDGPDTKISGVEVQGCTFDTDDHAIYLSIDEVYNAYLYNYKITGNTIHSNAKGIYVYAVAVDAHGVTNIYDILVNGNMIDTGGTGIEIYADSGWSTLIYNIKCENNSIISQDTGINIYGEAIDMFSSYVYIHNISILDCSIETNANGIWIYSNGYDFSKIYDIQASHIMATSTMHTLYLYAYGQRESHIYNVAIENNQLISGGNAIYLDSQAHDIFYSSANIYNLTISASNLMASGDGIYIYTFSRYSSNTYDILIERNNISSCGSAGIKMEVRNYKSKYNYDTTILNNVVTSNGYGIVIIEIHTNITRNTISYNNYGVQYINSSTNLARYNDIYQNSGYGMYVDNSNVDAKYNYWGDETGPKHLALNILGLGNPVNGNGEDLIFQPWLEAPAVTPNEKPIANLKVSKETAVVGESITFDASASSDDVSVKYYYFDFGDGTDTGWIQTPVVEHSYNAEGVYTVTLVVKDDLGVTSEPTYKTVTIVKAEAIFTISSLRINPDKASVGETITISVDVSNTGNAYGTATLTLKINGSIEATRPVSLNPGESTTVQFQVVKNKPGTYIVEIDGLRGSFQIIEVSQVRLKLSNLIITPSEIEAGESAQITVTATIEGKGSGTFAIPLLINGEKVDEKTISLSEGESKTITFTYTFMHPGTYTIEIGGLSRTINVAEHMPPSHEEPQMTIFGGLQQIYLLLGLFLIVIVVIVALALARR